VTTNLPLPPVQVGARYQRPTLGNTSNVRSVEIRAVIDDPDNGTWRVVYSIVEGRDAGSWYTKDVTAFLATYSPVPEPDEIRYGNLYFASGQPSVHSLGAALEVYWHDSRKAADVGLGRPMRSRPRVGVLVWNVTQNTFTMESV
jgi:hypothetical protein